MNEAAPPPGLALGQEIRRSVQGAYRLLLFDAGALRYFTLSIGGFWRSFIGAAIAAPVYLMIVVLQDRLIRAGAKPGMDIPPLAAKLGTELLSYPLGVVLFPLAMIPLARLLKITGRYVPYIIAYNWAGVIAALLAVFPLLLFGLGLFDSRSALAFLLGMNVVILVYLWFIARTALAVPGLTAAGLVTIDVVLSFLLDGLMDLAAG